MCGFVGIRRLDGAPVDEHLLAAAAARLAHRGPDGEGIWIDGSIGFAHRRLAIIDVDGSPQPLASADGRAHIAFNGEILNYRQLRRALRYPFRTAGDTEVLLALHQARGQEAPQDLRGQFAYAVHDDADGSTLLVRDRLGILPLYYAATDSMIAFASEAKALLLLLPDPPVVDEASLDAYLTRRAVPAPATLFRGISKLPPGHLAEITCDGRFSVRPYWQLPAADTTTATSDAEAVGSVREALEQAVAENLVADVPVGAYLSGGLDSSLITALASRRTLGPIRTFAAGFGDAKADDLPFARLVSEHLGTEHTEVHVVPDDFVADWDRLTWHRDAPLSEPADLAVHRLAVAAADSVKVVLSGEGSDELFGGYPKHRLARATAWAGLAPQSLRTSAASAADHLPRRIRRARIGLRALEATTEDERMAAWFAPFTAAERAALLGAPPPSATRHFAATGGDPLRRMLLADSGPWLADNLLERGDRMTMAASVELRPPFLDHRLVELAFRLPSRMKVRAGTGKWVLRHVATDLLPHAVLRRPKVGFRVPLGAWFRGGLRELAWDRLLSPSSFVTSVFDRDAVARVLQRHEQGRADEEIRIWTLLGLEVWHDVCVAGAGATAGRSR